MCQGDGLNLVFASDPRERFVPKLARSHFNRDFLRPRELSDIGALDRNGENKALSCPPHQLLVRIAAAPTKLMIEMGNMQLPAERLRKPLQNIEQNHRIDASRNSNQNLLPFLKKV